MREYLEIKEIKFDDEISVKNFLKKIGLTSKCIESIELKSFKQERINKCTIHIEITSNLGELIVTLLATTKGHILSYLDYYGLGYEFDRNVNLPYEYEQSTENSIEYTYLER